MQVGLISDTHDRLDTLRAALDMFRQRGVRTLIHAGDIVAPFAARLLREYPGPVHVIFGNNDGERAGLRGVLPQICDGPLQLDLDGCAVLVHHFLDWCTPDDLARARVVVTGHTHAAGIEEREGRLFINPGECCGWVTGRCTVAVLDTDGPRAELLEVQP